MAEEITVGVLGLRRGLSHLKNFLKVEGARVIGAADRIEQWRDRAATTAADMGHPLTPLREFDDLLELKPDAVVIASNGRQQAQQTMQALEAGCHVISEVPGAYTQDEILRIAATVESTGRQYMLAENSSYMGFLRYWRRWMMEGRFGAVSMADGEYLHYLPTTLVDADGNQYTPSEVKAQGITGVTPLWRSDQPPIQYLTHDLGPLLEVLDDRVVSVNCIEGPWWNAETPLRSDGQYALFKTAKGRLIRILVTLNTRRPGAHNYRMFGTEGSVEWYAHEGFCRRLDKTREEKEGWERIDIGTARDDVSEADSGHGGTDIWTAITFTRALLAGKRVPIDVYRMADYTLPGILANRSAENGGGAIHVPDIRREPFEHTEFWDHIGLPEDEPAGQTYESGTGITY
ncbi:MAG: Gfo/Idh/MocA family oxidoreductase [Gemmatimonadetes bacterium]|nr:Gfo/Idh/MocA family oxidoreductase [Gemmatimonadota bacterium]MBT7859474.1 Gfo/Idh/MocA family oxidoreductase [Gemmatimonadota bacterium]